MDDKVKRLYENCKAHMHNTCEDWRKAIDAFNILYPKLSDQGKADALAAINMLEKEIVR